MTTDDWINALREAQAHLRDAVHLIETYTNATGDSYARHDLLDHLKIMAGRDHGLLSRDLNLDDLIDALEQSQ